MNAKPQLYASPMVNKSWTLREEVAIMGQFLNKNAFKFDILARRAGFTSTAVLNDIKEYANGEALHAILPNGSTALVVKSSDANDVATTGTGTRTIKITYLDSTGVLTTTADINMNGTTEVATGLTTAIQEVLWMEAISGGTSEVSAGNITLQVTGAGQVYDQITAGGNKSMRGMFAVPLGYTGYLVDWDASAINTTQDLRLRATVQSHDRSLGTRYIFQHTSFLSSGQIMSEGDKCMRFPALAKIKVSTIAGATAVANRVDCNFTVIIIQD